MTSKAPTTTVDSSQDREFGAVLPSPSETTNTPIIHREMSTDYEAAREKYADAMTTLGYQADLAYNAALCYFKNKQYGAALKQVGEFVMTNIILTHGFRTDDIYCGNHAAAEDKVPWCF